MVGVRIGQVAALVGVSTRTIRHWHHMGVLPEPTREANGYRSYSIQDAVLLARARRLTALGMSLEEVADSLSSDQAADLNEILGELDQDLARQEQEIREARTRIAELRSRTDTIGDDLLTPPALTQFVEQLAAAGTSGTSAQLDAYLMSLLPEGDASAWLAEFLPDPTDLQGHQDLKALYDQMDAIAEAGADDPRVAALVVQILDSVPENMKAEISGLLASADHGLIADAIASQLTHSQQAVYRQVLARLSQP